jgi:chemotaxis protein MotB
MDATRLPHMAESLREAVGGQAPEAAATAPSPAPDPIQAPPAPDAIPPPQVDVRVAIERELGADLASGRLEMTEDRRGVVLAIPEAFSFETGSADLSGLAAELMRRVGGVLRGLPNAVRVEGHTDDTPIHTPRFTSNWDLSTARATEVVAFFIAEGLTPGRLSAAGYSEFHPRSSNDSAAGRARNRRVDIVILNPATRTSEEPGAAEGVHD